MTSEAAHNVSDTTLSHTHALLEDAHQQSLVLQEQIERLQTELSQLNQQQNLVQSRIAEYKSILAPINRLPTDILQEIFLRCLPLHHGAIMKAQECPLLLTHICHHWRSVALSTPMLWASLHIHIPSIWIFNEEGRYTSHAEVIGRVSERRAEVLFEWLTRSGDCTLDITLHMRATLGSQRNRSLDTILDVLIPFSERWGSLQLNIFEMDLQRIVSLPASAVPRLHTLMLPTQRRASPMDTRSKSIKWALSGILNAPRLRVLSYSSFSEDITKFTLRFGNLTSLCFHGHGKPWFTLADLASLLLRCHSLRYLGVDASPQRAIAGTASVMPTTIPLLHLTGLTIRIPPNCVDIQLFLDALHTPSLCDVDLNCRDYSLISVFLQRISPKISKLTVDPTTLPYDLFLQCAYSSTSLTHLVIRRSDYVGVSMNGERAIGSIRQGQFTVNIDNIFLLAMMCTTSNEEGATPTLFPRLSYFQCDIDGQVADAGILQFVYSRRASLTYAYMCSSSDFERPPIVGERVNQLASEGIRLYIKYTIRRPKGSLASFPVDEGIVQEPWKRLPMV